ncbi:related to short chain oxidoreductase/dehydrogenase [Phialocephala subalpina]|uniref:Related to short chain oxidoreductase/dehydrogenase n=1 Tax=Phialocephala subalpina TaxID=576137 RepID=A0A1L7WE62_9HELO|nr:related to short chain oxidoreductase/dehydrogenase [Phialocephala subalpina]
MSSPTTPLVWLITGSSSGFGTSLTFIALNAGHKVIATSRNPSKTPDLVKQVEDLGGIWLALDVTDTPENLQKVVAEGTKKFGRIDILANVAGIGILGALEDFSPKEAQLTMDVNFFGPMKLTQAVLPQMRARRSGTIVNFSSGAGINPSPTMGMYAATKFALEGFSQGLANDVAPFNIRVLIVQPGAFTTNMMNAIMLTEKEMTKDYHDTPMGPFLDFFKGDQQFKAANNVEKGCQAVFEVVTGTGRGKGKEEHLRLLLSSDVAQRALDQNAKIKAGYDAFRDVWENTTHDGGVRKAFNEL